MRHAARRFARVLAASLILAALVLAPGATANAAGDPSLDALILTDPVPGWTATPSGELQTSVDRGQKLMSDIGQQAEVAMRGWASPDTTSRLVIELIRTAHPFADPSRQVQSFGTGACGSATGNGPASNDPFSGIPQSYEFTCASTSANGVQVQIDGIAWVEANVLAGLIIVNPPGGTTTQLESFAQAQYARVPPGGVYPAGGSTAGIILAVVVALVLVGAIVGTGIVLQRRSKGTVAASYPAQAGAWGVGAHGQGGLYGAGVSYSPPGYGQSPYGAGGSYSPPGYGQSPYGAGGSYSPPGYGRPGYGSYAPATITPAPDVPATNTPAPDAPAPEASAPEASAPPGWHQVGNDSHRQAYWDGTSWTQRITWNGTDWVEDTPGAG